MKIEVVKLETYLWQAHVVDVDKFNGMAHQERDPGRAVTGLMAQMSVRLPSWPLKKWAKNIEVVEILYVDTRKYEVQK